MGTKILAMSADTDKQEATPGTNKEPKLSHENDSETAYYCSSKESSLTEKFRRSNLEPLKCQRTGWVQPKI